MLDKDGRTNIHFLFLFQIHPTNHDPQLATVSAVLSVETPKITLRYTKMNINTSKAKCKYLIMNILSPKIRSNSFSLFGTSLRDKIPKLILLKIPLFTL